MRIIAIVLLLTGCAPIRVLFAPRDCHPAAAIPDGAGGFVIVPDPCEAVKPDARRP